MNQGEQERREGRSAEMGPWDAARSSLVPEERRIETACVLFVAPAILPEGSAYSSDPPTDQAETWGKDQIQNGEYNAMTTV